MPATTPVDTAREIFAGDCLAAEEVGAVFGAIDAPEPERLTAVPFPEGELRAARERGELLVLRAASIGGEPLTLHWLIRRFPQSFDPAYLEKMGYQLKSEWGIALEPIAEREVCEFRWALVGKEPLAETYNLSYEEQEEALAARGATEGIGRARRRSATEIAYDLIAYDRARGTRLLGDRWDWSRSRTGDGGFLNVGHFSDAGMQVFSFSPGVRHGKLGVCVNRVA
jgi:hypothetical protein